MVPVEVLKRFSLFEGLTESQLARLACLCREKVYEAGSPIHREGQPSSDFYLVKHGKVNLEMELRVWPQEMPGQVLIETVARGETFGWSAVAEPHVRTLAARPVERTELIVIDGAELHQLLEDDHDMGYMLMQRLANVISGRLRETGQKLVEFMKELEVAREYLPEEATLVERIHYFIRLRWLAALGVVLIAWVANTFFGIGFATLPVYSIAVGIALYNLIFWFYARNLAHQQHTALGAKVRVFAYAQSVTDLVATTFLVHWSGGLENPFIFYYVFHVILASILLSPRVAYFLATLAVILLGSSALLEYGGIIPHVYLQGFMPLEPISYLPRMIGILLAFTSTIYVSCYLSTSITGELRKWQWEIVVLKDRLLLEAKELEEKNKELVRLDALKTYFLAMASHDLKTPLAAVESYLQVILGGFAGEVSEQHRHMLERSSHRIKELFALINRFLDFARIERGEVVQKMEMTPLGAVVDSCVEEGRALADEKGQEFRVKRPSKLPEICASPTHLHQVLSNLLGNAVKFTPADGTVTLKVKETDDGIRFEVEDTGVGIDPEDMPRIFEDFYRGKAGTATGRGTGLGLSIAKKIVEAHQGKIWAESPYAKGRPGSRFVFIIPKSLRGGLG